MKKRILHYLLLLALVIAVNFFLPRLLPGSPIRTLTGEDVGSLTAAEKQGILAARAAGMRSCFIPDTIEPDDQMKELIDLQCESLHDVIGILEEMI